MITYTVLFRSDLQRGTREFDADTPEQALEIARRFVAANPKNPDIDFYETRDCPINEIKICDDDGDELAIWYDDDRRLRIAALDLLEAAELVVARWERGDLAEAVRLLSAAIAKAKGGAV